MISPPALKQNDKIIILSTARKISMEDLEFGIELLTSFGLQVELGESIHSEDHQFAGSDEIRARDLQKAINDPEIKAIFCARGGYGSVRIIDQVDFTPLTTNPKWIVGYSDVTVILNHLANLNVASLHATMPINYKENTRESISSLYAALFGQPITHEFTATSFRDGQAEGKLIGGNLSIIYSLLSSASDVSTAGKILFIEDLDEYLYHIDRMMMALKRAGKLDQLAGLLIGGMTDMNDNAIPFGKSAVAIIQEHVAEYDYPVVFDCPFGHIDDNRAITVNKKASLTVVSDTVKLAF